MKLDFSGFYKSPASLLTMYAHGPRRQDQFLHYFFSELSYSFPRLWKLNSDVGSVGTSVIVGWIHLLHRRVYSQSQIHRLANSLEKRIGVARPKSRESFRETRWL